MAGTSQALLALLVYVQFNLISLLVCPATMDNILESVEHFKSNRDEGSRLEDITRIKSIVKHHSLPPRMVVAVLDVLALSFGASTKTVEAALTLLAYLIKRLILQDTPLDLPALIETIRLVATDIKNWSTQ